MVASRFTLLFSLAYLAASLGAYAYDATAQTNVAVYWGQNSYGAANPTDTAGYQQPIEAYCGDDSIDVIPMAFVNVFFGTGGLPSLNLANSCNPTDNTTFAGSTLPDCSAMAAGIKTCQTAGKIVTISLGGASGSIGFTDDSQASGFADLIWDLFLGGTSTTRPFGDAVLDGVDLDIEGGATTGYSAFVTQLRTHTNGASKTYYVTGAPQCPFPDAELGSTLNTVGFDAVYVQFYNNFCGLTNYDNVNAWDYAQWDDWAKNTSPNKDVKVFIGAPASTSAAGSGYVDAATLGSITSATKANYTSFGGVMLWDASQAAANGNYAAAIKSSLTGGAAAAGHTSTKSVQSSSTGNPSSTASSANPMNLSSTSRINTSTGKPSPTASVSKSSANPMNLSSTSRINTATLVSAKPTATASKQSRWYKA